MISLFILQGGGSPSLLSQFFPLILVIFIIYFFFIRPQAKKQKEQNAFIKAMQKGDEVVTSSGIIGKINKLEENAVTLQVDSKTFIRVIPTSISKEMTDFLNKEADKK